MRDRDSSRKRRNAAKSTKKCVVSLPPLLGIHREKPSSSLHQQQGHDVRLGRVREVRRGEKVKQEESLHVINGGYDRRAETLEIHHYEPGKYDRLLLENDLENSRRIVWPEFADMQYAIRRALELSNQTAYVESSSPKSASEAATKREACVGTEDDDEHFIMRDGVQTLFEKQATLKAKQPQSQPVRQPVQQPLLQPPLQPPQQPPQQPQSQSQLGEEEVDQQASAATTRLFNSIATQTVKQKAVQEDKQPLEVAKVEKVVENTEEQEVDNEQETPGVIAKREHLVNGPGGNSISQQPGSDLVVFHADDNGGKARDEASPASNREWVGQLISTRSTTDELKNRNEAAVAGDNGDPLIQSKNTVAENVFANGVVKELQENAATFYEEDNNEKVGEREDAVFQDDIDSSINDEDEKKVDQGEVESPSPSSSSLSRDDTFKLALEFLSPPAKNVLSRSTNGNVNLVDKLETVEMLQTRLCREFSATNRLVETLSQAAACGTEKRVRDTSWREEEEEEEESLNVNGESTGDSPLTRRFEAKAKKVDALIKCDSNALPHRAVLERLLQSKQKENARGAVRNKKVQGEIKKANAKASACFINKLRPKKASLQQSNDDKKLLSEIKRDVFAEPARLKLPFTDYCMRKSRGDAPRRVLQNETLPLRKPNNTLDLVGAGSDKDEDSLWLLSPELEQFHFLRAQDLPVGPIRSPQQQLVRHEILKVPMLEDIQEIISQENSC